MYYSKGYIPADLRTENATMAIQEAALRVPKPQAPLAVPKRGPGSSEIDHAKASQFRTSSEP